MNDDSQPSVSAFNVAQSLTQAPSPYANGTQSTSSAAVATVEKPAKTQKPKADDSQKGQVPTGWRQTFTSLSERNFLFLWLGMLCLMAGMQMQMLARGYLVYDLTGSASLLGVVNAGTAVPMLTLSLFGGAIADRIDRKRIIQFGQVLAAILAVIVGVTIISGYVTWYYLFFASVIQGAIFSFMMPARQAVIPQLVGQDKVNNAMALNGAAMSSMTLVAPALAGGLYAFAGPHNVYFVVGGLAAAASVLTSLVHIPAGSQPA